MKVTECSDIKEARGSRGAGLRHTRSSSLDKNSFNRNQKEETKKIGLPFAHLQADNVNPLEQDQLAERQKRRTSEPMMSLTPLKPLLPRLQINDKTRLSSDGLVDEKDEKLEQDGWEYYDEYYDEEEEKSLSLEHQGSRETRMSMNTESEYKSHFSPDEAKELKNNMTYGASTYLETEFQGN